MRIYANGLGRSFPDVGGGVIEAVSQLDLDVPAGEFLVVSGPSGCGKSTLLNLIGLLDRLTTGGLQIGEVDVTGLGRKEAARFRCDYVGFLFQDAGLLEPMSVMGNLDVVLAYRQVRRSERRKRALAVLERLGIASKANQNVARLSGGERQRVGLARALVSNPRLLICDEPTAALDAETSKVVVSILEDVARSGVTVVASSHDPIVISAAKAHIRLLRGRRAEEVHE